MTESRAQIPEFTLEVEIDMEAAAEAREAVCGLSAASRSRPSTTSWSRRWRSRCASIPAVNSSWAGGRIRRNARVNVGIAVATDDALYVPTLPDADTLPIFELAGLARSLIKKVLARHDRAR